MPRLVRDDAAHPDPAFAELYSSLPDAIDLEPWLAWCRQTGGEVLYLGVGAGRLAVPLADAGVDLVGVDAHPGMLVHLRARRPGLKLVRSRIEQLGLGRRYGLVIAPSNILHTVERLRGAAQQSSHRVALELTNPHWLAAGASPGVRVVGLSRDRAEIEVDYPGSYRQVAEIDLVWPEEVEDFLLAADLELEKLRGSPGGGLDDSPSFFVLARRLMAPEPRAGRHFRPGARTTRRRPRSPRRPRQR
jgi:hypothetical protein